MSDTDSCCPDGSWPGVVEDKDREVSGEVGDLDGGLKYYYSAPPSDSTKVACRWCLVWVGLKRIGCVCGGWGIVCVCVCVRVCACLLPSYMYVSLQ